MTNDLLKNYGDDAAALAAIGAVLFGIYKYVIKPLYMWIRSTQEIFDKLEIIHYQLVPNSGASIKDALNRIEARQLMFESRNRALLLDSQIGYWESDKDGNCIWCNRALTRFLGRTIEQIKGSGWGASIHPPIREKVMKEWAEAVHEQREYDEPNMIYTTPDGDITHCRTRAYPIMDANNQVQGYLGVANPIMPMTGGNPTGGAKLERRKE